MAKTPKANVALKLATHEKIDELRGLISKRGEFVSKPRAIDEAVEMMLKGLKKSENNP